MIALDDAHRIIARLPTLEPCPMPLGEALGLALAEDVHAQGDCPTIASSLKDGYAVRSADIAAASPQRPVSLRLGGLLAAGDTAAGHEVQSGCCLRVLTGGPLPAGATAVLAQEFARVDGATLAALADAPPGKNVLSRGSDIATGQCVLHAGQILQPAALGLAAAAGLGLVPVRPRPRVAVVATGSELVWPGEGLGPGRIAASNMVIAAAELRQLGIDPSLHLERDHLGALERRLAEILPDIDLLITCGGILDGDKDLTMRAMEALGMEKFFHRVRIGPGKGACCGRIGRTVVFNLPGGPPSHHVALLLLAMPGVRRLMGYADILPPRETVRVSAALRGQRDWTQLVYAAIDTGEGCLVARPLRDSGRLFAMAEARALIEIPEGCEHIEAGGLARVWRYQG